MACSGQALAALDVSMSVTPGYANPIYPGDITSFRISLSNSNAVSAVTGVGFTNSMPAQITVAGVGVKSYSCVDGDGTSAATSGTVTASGSTISLSGGSVPKAKAGGASGKCDIDVEVTSLVRNNAFINTIAAGAVTGTDNTGAVANGTQAQQSINVNNFALPTISKSFSSSIIVKGDETVRLSMVISNASGATTLPLNGASDSPAFALRDTLPAGLQVATTPNATATCSGAGVAPAFSPAAGNTVLTAVGGTVAAGGTCTLAVDLVGTTTGGAYNKDVVNTISRTADFGNKRGLVPASDATASLSIHSLLRVAKQFTLGTISAGQQSTLVITLNNDSPVSPITLTTFADSPIDGIGNPSYGLKVSGTPTTTCGGTATATGGNIGITMTGGAIPAKGSCTITVPYKGTLQAAGTPQAFTNTIAEGAVGTSDPDIVSKSATHSVTVVDQLLINKSSNPAKIAAGNPIQYTITINNYSSSPLSNVVLTDPLPSGVLALPAMPAAPSLSGTGCSGLSHNIPSLPASMATPRFTIGTVPAGTGAAPGACSVTFWAMAPKSSGVSTVLTNTIPAGNVGVGGIYNTNVSSAAATVDSTITISKVFNPSSTSEGTVSLLTLTLTNISSQAVTNAGFTDNLPLGSTGLQLVVANPASASTTCGGALTAVPGSNSISLSGANIPARANNGTGAFGTCQVQVKVIGPAGTYVNTLPAGALTGTQLYADGTTDTISSPGPVSASLTYTSALAASKVFSPATVSSGGKATVRINLTNKDTGTLNNVSVIDPLPAGMTIASPSNAYSTCGGSPVITATPGAASASVSGVVLPPNGKCDFLFDVIATGASNWVNTIPVGNVTATGGVQNVLPVTATLQNSTAGAVIVTNNTNPNSLSAPGASSVLTVNISNTGSVALSGLGLVNHFTVNGLANGTPTGMRVASTANLGTTCPGGIVSTSADGTSVTLSNATLAAGASCTITANVTLNTTGTVQDTIPVGAITSSQGISNTLLTVTSLSAGANIGVIKQFTPAVIKPGDRSRLRLTFINPVTLALNDLTAVDNLPAGLVVPAGANPMTTCSGATVSAPTANQVKVTGGSLPAATTGTSTTCYAEIDVQAASVGSYTNIIVVGDVTGTIGGGSASNPSPGTSTLEVRNPVTIGKAIAPASVTPGTPATVTLTLTNSNAIALTNAVLTDNLPANVVVAQAPNASTTCAGGVISAPISATSVALTGATLPANGSCTVKFDVVSNIAGVYVNTIPAGNLVTAQGVTNETPASATLSLLDPPTVNKQFSPIAISANGKSTLTIVLGNTNSTDATLSAALVDTLPTLPGNIVVATPNNLSGTCTLASVSAPAGGATVTYASGAKIPAGGCTISVDVTGTVEGTYNNFIPAGALVTNIGKNVQPASANLEISPLGFVSGKVFKDNNVVPNGTFELGTDVAIANVALTLTGTSYGPDGVAGGGDDTAVSLNTVTDALGNYAFTGLNPGSYSVTETVQPAGTMNGITTAGTIAGAGGGIAGTATGIAVTPSRISNIVLNKDGSGKVSVSANNNFAEVVPSSIGGKVFLDQNNNGVQDLADTALPGVTVELLNASSVVVATTVTDANGAYSFNNLVPGKYSVREPTQPENTVNGKTVAGTVGNGGTAGTPTANTVLPSVIANITLPPGTATTGNNFAEAPSGRQISGRVFTDPNNDGVFNAGDIGLAGVTINLSGTDVNGTAVTRTTTTGPDGRYTFIGLAEGTYTVTEPTQPLRTDNGITTAGSTGGTATVVAVKPSAISAINLTGTNSISVDNNFAEIPILVGVVSGKVYADANDNGVAEAGEKGIGGVKLSLTGTDVNGSTVNLSTTTAADGSYSFNNLPPSNAAGYTITELQPALYKDGKTTVAAGNPGTAASSKPVLSNNSDVIRNVSVIAGDVLTGYNFGEIGGLSLKPPIVNGYVYLDRDHTRVRPTDGSAAGLEGWTAQLTQNGTAVCTTTTDVNGFYQFDNLHCPGYEASGLPVGTGFEIGFNKDGNKYPALPTSGDNRGSTTAAGGSVITNITLLASDEVVEQNLPLDPSGVVYDSVTRNPIAGAVVRIDGPAGFNPTTHLVGGNAAQSQTVGSDGYYQYLLQNGFPSGTYTLSVTAPGGYLPAPSSNLPACNGAAVVGALPNPALVQASDTAPGLSVTQQTDPSACVGMVPGGATTTQYYFSFVITNGVSAPILNNHIPLDPVQVGSILVTKTTPLVNVARGDLVPYTITASNTLTTPIPGVNVVDQIPPGFKYRLGSATLNGVAVEPVVKGRVLTWPNQRFVAKEKKTYRLILTVGAGVGDGNYVNQAWAANNATNLMLSNLATATVRIVPDPTFDCPDIIGKVFDDRNANGYQDQDEPGIPAVRVVTPRGLLVNSDSEGRFHVPCADIPNADRGSNFVMKLDERSLPSGYRVTTENPRDVRITRGKVVKLNFGATIHRVIRIELSDAAFVSGEVSLLPQWQKQFDAVPSQLKQRPSVVRLAYQPGKDDAALVQKRVDAIRMQIRERWKAQKGEYTLNIETEDAQ
ncbi:SdrD B-like domain-containing protein [Noviherbaspirillum cavernae]|nr:SdrD B-like domain-containing protein [Noviherbaspirillum cavernae]